MSGVKDRWQALGKRFDAQSPRERALIAAAMVGSVLLLGFSLLVDPALSRARIAERQVAQSTSEVAAIQAQLQVLRTQLQVDPDAGRRSEIEGLKKDAAAAEAAILQIQSGLVSPEEMNGLLERLLAKNTGLRLLSLKSLPPVNLAESAAESLRGAEKTAPVAIGPGLFKHGVERCGTAISRCAIPTPRCSTGCGSLRRRRRRCCGAMCATWSVSIRAPR